MIKPLPDIVQFLLLQEGLTETLNTLPRIFGDNQIPAKYNNGDEVVDVVIGDGPILLVSLRGGDIGFDSVTGLAQLQFECIAEKISEAWAVYYALFDAIQDAKSGNILIAEINQFGQKSNYPETNWPVVITFGSALIREGVTS
ncbi:hypothetical protein LCGC14_1283750 [marine sediment metagenome]|uniref:Tail terminator n=1 Tax=marine sediment metagenome TaxID=412755 RepID=A0A0F9KW70_9ZZZZ